MGGIISSTWTWSAWTFRERQEITWAFECPIAPHLGSLLNRKIRDVERLRLWFRSIGRDPIWGTLGPQNVQLISCRSLIARHSFRLVFQTGPSTIAPGATVPGTSHIGVLRSCAKINHWFYARICVRFVRDRLSETGSVAVLR